MDRGFWDNLPRPFVLLAPMADVTDAAFRSIIAARGKPHAIWTEFVSADGLFLADEEGRAKLVRDLLYTEAERPIVAQFFTSRPEMMERAARFARELGFDGVDINMGCPDRSIEKQGAGAALIKNPARAAELVAAAKEGAGNLPVSVKTRLGYARDELDRWLPDLLLAEPAAVILHARTRKELSKVPARWDAVKRAVAIRDGAGSSSLIVGNGDVATPAEARARARESGADGVMIGRGVFGNPWLFAEREPDLSEKLRTLAEHARLFEKFLPHKSFAIMKKHFKAYAAGFPGAADLRAALMEAEDAAGVAARVESFLARRTAVVL